ncbi:MAG: translational GTPase TypA [Bdellovibrionaceae bacterium]|nr:translational GTPase TypA [Pseudobdellovibrionaceae bacterium]|tara:strand:+ start:26137 stop:27927 length:1791 start_codon:yes stop_codon:yes gene_type:complete
MNIRNIAIIAHVDHGKTTLIDQLLKQSGLFRDNEHTEDRMMDSMDLEKERGITISAKNASFTYRDTKVNIIDTPGHSDFGGEVERILNMVDGAIVLVDSSEGPLPQTRFVLSKALEQDIKVIVCVNKIDRPDRRIDEVLDEMFDLFIDVDATDEQADFETLYAVGRDGWATTNPDEKTDDLKVMFDWIIDKLPEPRVTPEKPLQLRVTNIDYSEYVGRLALGRIQSGSISKGQDVTLMQKNKNVNFRVSALYTFDGMKQVPVEKLEAGDVGVIAGMEDVEIGDTIADRETPVALERIEVEEPTVSMVFSVNDGPFAGLEGKKVTSRNIKDRLEKELLHNVAIKVEETDTNDAFRVMGRGELQMAVIIEQMRREGFELLVSKPQVIIKNIDGVKSEPTEMVTIDVPEEHVGVVTEKLGMRKGVMQDMSNKGSGRSRVKFLIPSRGLIGYRSEFLTDTRGTGLMSSEFAGWAPYAGDISTRRNGIMVADRKGGVTSYALAALEPRGRLFVYPGVEVYQGMVIGEHSKESNLEVNPCKEKKLTNVRASGTDDAVRLSPVKPMSLEYAMEWITDEELVEVTPENIRIRCRELDPNKRKRK